jgi:hypothetical protein
MDSFNVLLIEVKRRSNPRRSGKDKYEIKKYKNRLEIMMHNILSESHDETSGEGLNIKYYKDVNDLIQRLRILIGETIAGNTNVYNEIIEILNSLVKDNHITHSEKSKIISYIK